MAAMEWVGETWRTYVGNAGSIRDFRVQMRGSKTILAWTIYLLVLLAVTYMVYSGVYAQNQFGTSAASLQYQLSSTFTTILNTLAAAVCVIAPGLTAASIVGERQRKSFDLVFSAPVTPKYYLVGKMIASYRYTIMLIVLAIPAMALTAMLGGATWGDIAICCFLVSTNGLVLTAIALLVSSIVERVQAAVATSYLLVGLYVIVTLMISSVIMAGSMGAFGGGSGPIGEKPFLATLSPFMVSNFYGSFTMIADFKVPNWILNAVYTIALVRLALLGAGSALSPYGSSETKSLRIQGLLYLLGLTWLFVYIPMSSHRTSGAAFFVTIVLTVVCAAVPWIAAWGESERRVTSPDGGWSWKTMFIGSPSGAGPYLLAMMAAVAAGGGLVANSRAIPMDSLAAHLAHGLGVTMFFSGMTRWFCGSLGYARGKSFSHFVIIGMNVLMPVFLMVAIASSTSWGSGIRFEERNEWLLWPLWPIVAEKPFVAFYVYGILFGAAGAALWWAGERKAAGIRSRAVKPPEWQFERG